MTKLVLNQFAHKLYTKLASQKHENFFISPFSISTALSMCYAGARNETAQQLKDLLHISKLSDAEILDLNSKYISNIQHNLGGDVTITTANKIYPNVGFDVKKDFLELVTKHFHSGVHQVDYSKPAESADTINQWVAEQTRDKIKNLISPDSLNSLTRLVLVNAIYFKGNWLSKFDKENTQKREFRSIDGSKKEIDMMHLFGKKFSFMWHPEGIEASACTLPYVGEKIAMTIILPDEGKTLDQIEASLTPDVLNFIISCNNPEEKVNLVLPKFKLEHKTELSDSFKEMGAHLPFDQGRADFTGINADPSGLYISKVVHQAVVEVNEEGTEAAAATGIIMMTRCAVIEDPIEFTCDRPFLFVIHERTHNTTLFIGKYVKPE